jgi:pimeloyl-ACP methyl ester carboxylesterase
MRHILLLLAGLVLLANAAMARDSVVVFSEPSPLSRNAEMARRLLTPLTAAQMQKGLARSGESLSEQALEPGRQESFLLHVPDAPPPPGGYGLMVFVPPWKDARMPPGWARVLDARHMIFVSAARSGNDESILGRRMPLALIAAHNVMGQYPVDPQRVYVSGFSGGSRVAMRLALAYPDLFHGALLAAGSDPIGAKEIPLPPRDLFAQFQENTRLVYLTGDQDIANSKKDFESQKSMRSWCVFDQQEIRLPDRGHQPADAIGLEHGLEALLTPAAARPALLTACRAEVDKDLDARFARLDALTAAGKRDEARGLLDEIDGRFGGLAAPRSAAAAAGLDSRGAAP